MPIFRFSRSYCGWRTDGGSSGKTLRDRRRIALASVQCAKDVLRIIDQRARHRLRRVREKEEREARDVVRVQQAPERHACGGLGQPSLAFAERDRLHLPLTRRIDPTEDDAVDANAIETMRVRGV